MFLADVFYYFFEPTSHSKNLDDILPSGAEFEIGYYKLLVKSLTDFLFKRRHLTLKIWLMSLF